MASRRNQSSYAHISILDVRRVQPSRKGNAGDHFRDRVKQVGPDLAASTQERPEVLPVVRADILLEFLILNELYSASLEGFPSVPPEWFLADSLRPGRIAIQLMPRGVRITSRLRRHSERHGLATLPHISRIKSAA